MNFFKKANSLVKNKNDVNSNNNKDHLRLNIKGAPNKAENEFNNQIIMEKIRRQRANSITPMLNSKVRFKVWGYVGLFGVYCWLLYKLIVYRLKTDDLEIMEREVKEEFEIKRKIKEFTN